MDLPTFKKIIDQFPSLTHVKIQGMGEPLINKKLPDLIAYCTNKGITTTVISNGTLLTEAIGRKIIDAGLSEMWISFDGATKKTYESLRVGATFEKVLENISGLVEIKREKNSNIRIGMVCLVSSEQVLQEIPEYVQMAFSHGVKEVQLKKRVKHWKKSKNPNEYIVESVSKVNEYQNFDMYFEEALIKSRHLGINLTMTQDSDFSYSNPCFWPNNSVYISVEGKVVPCCTIGIPETWEMGDLMTDNIRNIWNNELYRALRKSLKNNNIPEICKTCYGLRL
jgi:pyrroloquinoline quinone biosynthesis protein E